MSADNRADFPQGWQPPPPRFPAEPPTSEILGALEAVAEQPRAAWVRNLYSRQFQDGARQGWFEWPDEPLDQHVIRLVPILKRLPEGPEMARALVDADGGSHTCSDLTLTRHQTTAPP